VLELLTGDGVRRPGIGYRGEKTRNTRNTLHFTGDFFTKTRNKTRNKGATEPQHAAWIDGCEEGRDLTQKPQSC
jgi:hypothetical protein